MSKQSGEFPEVREGRQNRKRKVRKPWSLYVTYVGRRILFLGRKHRHGRYQTEEQAQIVADKIKREWQTSRWTIEIEIIKDGKE